MKPPRRTVRSAMLQVVALAVLMGAIIAIATSLQGSNCGGNTAALHDVRMYLLIARQVAAGNPGRGFDVAAATTEQVEELVRIAADDWIRPARFLVPARADRAQPGGPRRVVIVCDRPFRNVPRRILGAADPVHAAGFSDGSVGLISVAEFAALDRSEFAPLDEILSASVP